jgi:hypothetical protein
MGRMEDYTNILALAKYKLFDSVWLKPIYLLLINRPINGTAIDTYRQNRHNITLVTNSYNPKPAIELVFALSFRLLSHRGIYVR